MTTVKSRHSFIYHLKEAEMKMKYVCPFLRVSQIIKTLRVYIVLGDGIKIRDVCMELVQCFKVHNLNSVYPKKL